MKKKYFFILFVLVLGTTFNCNIKQVKNKDNTVMKIENDRIDTILLIFDNLNWWMEQTYNSGSDEIESTGEAQAFIKETLNKLDGMNIKYRLENGRYKWIQ